MILFLTIIHIVVCFVLIIVILVQGGRGQGLTGPSFASGNVQSLLGTQAADFLTKATSVSAICFLLTCLGLNIFESRKGRSLLEGARQTAPVDVDAVKKALEKMTAEGTVPKGAATNAATASAPVEAAKAAAAAVAGTTAQAPPATPTTTAAAPVAAALAAPAPAAEASKP